MSKTTTIEVSTQTRDALQRLADRDGLTLDGQIAKLVRREHRRIIGHQLASGALSPEESSLLNASASDVAHELG
ncbi:MAG: hypothetical protein H6512_02970 [Acidimicrobiia bacterium]|nr:hypothetical protein [Acidimicrobiia bacterium]